MVTFRHPDGTEYTITEGHEKDVVDHIRHEMMQDPGSNKKYMEQVCNLLGEMYGVWVDTDNEKQFLEALVELKVLDKIE